MYGGPTEQDSVHQAATLETAELRPHIHPFVDAYEDVFDSRDPLAVTTFLRVDAASIVRNSPVIEGARAMLAWWRTGFIIRQGND